MIRLLLLSLALHAFHAQCLLYHHCLVAYIALYHSEGRIPALLLKSLSYFISVTVLGDMHRVKDEAWIMCFPALVVLLGIVQFSLNLRYLTPLICLVSVVGLHCLISVLY